eukprot:1580760-Rhodomonas_salina.4
MREGSTDEDVSGSAARSPSDQRGSVISPARQRTACQNADEGSCWHLNGQLTPRFAVPDVPHGLFGDIEETRNVAGEAGAGDEHLILTRTRRTRTVNLLNLLCLQPAMLDACH